MKIGQMMRTHLVRVTPTTPLSEVIRLYREIPDSSRMTYVVDSAGRILGVVTLFHLLNLILSEPLLHTRVYKALESREDALAYLGRSLDFNKDRPVGEVMGRDFDPVGTEEPFLKANRLFVDKRVSAMPVVDADGVLVGELTRRVMINAIADSLGAQAGAAPAPAGPASAR